MLQIYKLYLDYASGWTLAGSIYFVMSINSTGRDRKGRDPCILVVGNMRYASEAVTRSSHFTMANITVMEMRQTARNTAQATQMGALL